MKPCPRAWDFVPLRDVLVTHPGLTAVEACLALDALKRALCPCHEVCARWADQLVAARRELGEAIPRPEDLR
ncbi:MAG: hypothetical protein AB1578_12025 [Thermodesulfobacteriota bacterium]